MYDENTRSENPPEMFSPADDSFLIRAVHEWTHMRVEERAAMVTPSLAELERAIAILAIIELEEAEDDLADRH